MRLTLLALLAATLSVTAETTPAPATPSASPAAPAVAPAQEPKPATTQGALTAEEQRQLRNARAKANKLPEVAAALKAEDEAYRIAREAKTAKKPKAELDALYAKARDLRAAREKLRDDAMVAANPGIKPLVEKAAQRAKPSPAAPAVPAAAPAKEATTEGADS